MSQETDKSIETDESINEIQNHEHSQGLKEFERYPSARFPNRGRCMNDIIPLEVIIKSTKPLSSNGKYNTSIKLKIDVENNKEIPVQVIVECDDDGFEIDGKYYAIINVPINNEDSKPIVFNIKSKKEGNHTDIIFVSFNKKLM